MGPDRVESASPRGDRGHRHVPTVRAADGAGAWLPGGHGQRWWSSRAAMAPDLSDRALPLAGLAGAGAIAVSGWTWVDPPLSLTIGLWPGWGASRLLARRARRGRR